MAATDFDSSFAPSPGSGTGHSLSRTRDILIETMQLVEPRKETRVPNHLLESKIYSKVAQTAVIQAQPSVIHFGGFEPGVTLKQVIDLSNVSTEVQRMHIIPPQTKYFYIRYKKGDRLVPGLALECTVEFTPDEWRYYYDCIRVHCKGEENLVIPIHAYPVMNTADFPQIVRFPPVPVGHSRSKVFPLRCQAPIDFEFQLTCLQPHPAFRVEPMSGIVPANGEVDMVVTFSPTEFNTACMRLQLVISQFNAKPLICTFTGSSAPGLAKQLLEEAYDAEETDSQSSLTLDPRAISPLDRARKNKKVKANKKPRETSLVKEREKDGIRFPDNLDTPYAVAQVLNQQPGKLRIKDLREAVLSKKVSSDAPTRQMKEAMFEMAIRKDVYEERQNQLRWQVKVGDVQITPTARQEVLESRQQAWMDYKRQRGDPVEEEEYFRCCNNCIVRRTRRECSETPERCAQFDVYKNDPWAIRHSALHRFRQAARKIIIRLRANNKLLSLRQMVLDWGEKKYDQRPNSGNNPLANDMEATEEESFLLQVPRVKSFTFPTYVAPNVKDDMAVDALGPVSYQPTEISVKHKVPFLSLKVPQEYVLMGYKPFDVHEASHGYVSPNLARPLRTGAEEEIISLGDVPDDLLAPTSDDLELEDIVDEGATELAKPPMAVTETVAPIKAPEALFRPIDYPALHIFNPAPGLQVYQSPLPYTETDPDFHLCPLPRYTSTDTTNPHKSTQRHYLDREDTIRGIMNWKHFPSQGLTSLSNTPTLSGVWVPRWQDPFNASLLPSDVPPLFTSLPDDDRENIAPETDQAADIDTLQEEGEEVMTLTPEMVLAEFSLIETAATPGEESTKKEEQREQDLDFFLKKKYNRLGHKIQTRVQQQDSLKTDPKLVLK